MSQQSDARAARAARAEWTAVTVLTLGMMAITAAVIAIDINHRAALILAVAGVVVTLIGMGSWTALVKARSRAARTG